MTPEEYRAYRKEQKRLCAKARRERLKEENNEEYLIKAREAVKKSRENLKTKAETNDSEAIEKINYIKEYNRVYAKNHSHSSSKPKWTPPDEIPIFSPIKKLIKRTTNKNELKEVTTNTYISFIRNFSSNFNIQLDDDYDLIKAIRNEKFNYKKVNEDFKFLKDKTKIYEIIRLNLNNIKLLYNVFTRIRGFALLLRYLYPYLEYNHDDYLKKRSEMVCDDEVKQLLNFNKDELILKISNTPELTYDEKLIHHLLTMIHTRRPHDYRICRISNQMPNDTFDSNYNYYFDGNIYIWNTKRRTITQKILKLYEVIKVPDEIIQLIDLNNPFIFSKEYDQPRMTRLIQSSFFKIYNFPFNARTIRKLYCDHLNTLGLNLYEREAIARQMGHSIAENMRYEHAKTKKEKMI